MAERKVIHLDYIIGTLAERMPYLRHERGDLTDAQTSIASMVYDLLWWIGVPESGIRMILGADADAIQGEPGQSVQCSLCCVEAVGLVQTGDGWRLVCDAHAVVHEENGLTVERK